MKKLLIPALYLKNGKALQGFGSTELRGEGDALQLSAFYRDHGADELLIFDFSDDDASHEEAIASIKNICMKAEVPVTAAGNVKRLEDVKKLIYAGCARVALNFSKQGNIELLPEVSKRFGKEKMAVCVSKLSEFKDHQLLIEEYASTVISLQDISKEISDISDLPVIIRTNASSEQVLTVLEEKMVCGVTGEAIDSPESDLMQLKEQGGNLGLEMMVYESAVSWSEFKLNEDGMIPVIVQDYKTDEVLMLAYMNEEAFDLTLRSGRMTYYSRSRQEIWVKGLTSGHYQYVKSLSIDCDKDTLLAKVDQVGAACHTGNRSCFYTTLMKKEYDDTNPLRVFQDVYDVILDRKVHPKEGSYTNYLFDKGIDKILKKVGEECTEIVIAAKNPDKEEIKYEISDFLYHVMVLMAEKGVTWEDITRELARR